MIRKTILGGLFFLMPIALIAILLGKAFQMSMVVASKIDEFIPFDDIGGIAMANILAVVLILLVCFLAGLAANLPFFARRVARLDRLMIDLVPGYAIVKNLFGGVAKIDDAMQLLKPVLLRLDDYEQIAFEIERTQDRVVVFLPGAPSAWSGSSVYADPARVTPLSLPTHEVISLLRVLGRGSTMLTLPKPSRP